MIADRVTATEALTVLAFTTVGADIVSIEERGRGTLAVIQIGDATYRVQIDPVGERRSPSE